MSKPPKTIADTQSRETQAVMRAIQDKHEVTEVEAMNLALLSGNNVKVALGWCKKILRGRK